eukprot:209576-Chlamydomonas_euryale.AAC.1
MEHGPCGRVAEDRQRACNERGSVSRGCPMLRGGVPRRAVTSPGAIFGGRRGLATSATMSSSWPSRLPRQPPPPRRCGGTRPEATFACA